MKEIPLAALIAALVLPLFYFAIYVDYAVGRRQGRDDYDLKDTLASLGVAMTNSSLGVLTVALRTAIYTLLLGTVSLEHWSSQWLGAWTPSWALDSVWTWLIGLLLYDFTYYWQHRLGHELNILWASHVIHHSSTRFNLATALRVPSASMHLWTWIFAVPLALIGMPTTVFAVATLLNLLYQFWIHTERIGSLGWFDRVFGSPSNHRVHHGVNDCYIDKNYGGILMLWDHLFGTFEDERLDEPVRFGTRDPVRSWNPLWINLHTFVGLLRQCLAAPHWLDKLTLWLRRPGWQPRGLRSHKPAFDLAQHVAYDNPVPRGIVLYALAQMALLPMQVIHLIATQYSLDMVSKSAYSLYIFSSAVGLGLLLNERAAMARLGRALEFARLAVSAVLVLAGGQWFAHLPLDPIAALGIAALAAGSALALGWALRSAPDTAPGAPTGAPTR